MLVLITYDVNIETTGGKARLRKAAKQCINYGRRVRNSVFEYILDNAQYVILKSLLAETIDEEVDSLRSHHLGNKYKTKVEHVRVDEGITVDEALFLQCECEAHMKSTGDSHQKKYTKDVWFERKRR